MSKNRRGQGRGQGNHSTRFSNRGSRGSGHRNNSPHVNNSYRDNTPVKPEGIYHNHSILAALSHLVGRTVHVRSKNGSIYEGIFCTLSPKATIVLKCVHRIEKKHANGFNGNLTRPLPHQDDVMKELVFEFHDVISIAGKIDKSTKDSKGDGFVVDSEVGKRRQQKPERKELQKWTDGCDMHQSLDEMSLDNDTGNGWTYEDMIRTNEEKFNVSSVYDESMHEYTVPVPQCDEETKRKAAQLADDIERKVTTNVHVAEERGQILPVEASEEERYSAVLRPEPQFIEITESRKGYSAEIPAPLSQIDEPTEDVFKEEKEAALKKQKEATETVPPAQIPAEPMKCVVETQTEPATPKAKPIKAVSPNTSQPSSPRVTKPAQVELSKPEIIPTPQVHSPVIVQHAGTQVAAKKEPEEVPVQKQIMKPDRSRKEAERKEGLLNFKTQYEDSTQSKGPKIPATVAQTSGPTPQVIQQASQQPVAAPQPPMLSKQRNDSMSSDSSYTINQHYQQPRHSIGHMQGVYNPVLQQQQMMQMQAAHQMHQIQQLQQQQHMHLHQHMQQQQAAQHQQAVAAANNQHAAAQQQFPGAPNLQAAYQMQQHMAAVQQRHMQHQLVPQPHDKPPSNLNPDAMEFKPGSSATSSPLPPAAPPKQVMLQPDKNNMMVMPQPLAVIPAQLRQPELAVLQPNSLQGGAIMSQYGAHGPSLVIYPTNTLLPRGYITPAVSMAAMQHNPNLHNVMVNSHHDQQNPQPTGIMSPTSPTTQAQILYHHPQQQMISQGQYLPQTQMHPTAAAHSHLLQLQSAQMSNVQSQGPYANPLQPHAAVFQYAHPPNVG